MTELDLLDALRDCYDPQLRRNIVDLRLVRSVALTRDPDAPGANLRPRFIAAISITSPGSDETANAQLAAQIENRLLGIEAISQAKITLLPPLFPIL